MKKNLLRLAVIILILFYSQNASELFSQTSGTFSFSVTTAAPSGSYGSNNLLVIWIEDNLGAFVKTKVKLASAGNYDHMATWTTSSGQNTVDATTGATRSSQTTPVTFLWNATNVAGAVVTDGTYNVWLELAWDKATINPNKAVTSYGFNKASSAQHLTPADVTYFKSVVLDWAPLATGVEGTLESKELNVYPNPSDGLLKINFKSPEKEVLINVINEAGRVVYTERIKDLQQGIHTLDLTRLAKGNYYCTMHFPGRDVVFDVILVK